MVSHISSTNRDLPLVEAAQMGNLEAIASLLQQTLTVAQANFLPNDVVQTVMQTVDPMAIALGQASGQASGQFASRVVIDGHDSRWTKRGMILLQADQNSDQDTNVASSKWQLRPTLDPVHCCEPLTRLLGRQEVVNGAIAALQTKGAIAISAQNGTGKTALLRALCHHPQLMAQFSQGIFYLRGYDRPLDDLWQSVFDSVYQVAPGKTVSANTVFKPTATEIQQWLSHQSICVVLDELTGDGHQGQDLVRWSQLSTHPPLLMAISAAGASSNQGQVVLDRSFKGQQVALQGLPLQEAIVLLEEGLGRSLQTNEWSDAQYLCQQLGGHPQRLMQYAALVQQRQHSLAELVSHLRRGTPVDALILKTIGNLPDPERRIVAILATLGGTPIHPNHLPTLMNLSRGTTSVDEPLQTLMQYNLVVVDGPYCRLADNLVASIQRSWNLEPWANQIIRYFAAWLTQLTTASFAMSEIVVPIQANSDTLWGVLRLAARQQQWATVLSMGMAMEQGLWLGKQWGRWQQVLLLQWFAARSLQDKAAEATILHQLGSRALCVGDRITAQAYLTQAFHYRRERGDTEGAALTQHNLMSLHRKATPKTTPQATQIGQMAHRSPSETSPNSPIPQSEQLPTPAESPSADRGQESSTGSHDDPPSPENTVILSSPSWFSWARLAMVLGAIATLGLGFFLLRQQSFEYGLRPQYTFPPQRTRIPSEPYFFTITNTTSGPLPISIAFSQGNEQDFSLISDDCTDQPLAPAEECNLVATFTPQNDGPRLATFTVNIGQADEPKTLTLRGVGANVEAELRPYAMTFGQQIIAAQSQSQTITFRNKGSVAFMVSETVLRDNPDNAFTLEQDNCSQQLLQPRDSCSLTFAFAPTAQTTYQSVLDVVDDTGTAVWSVALTGTGIPLPDPVQVRVPVPLRGSSRRASVPSASPSPNPSSKLQISPMAIAFGNQPLNGSAIRSVTVTNTNSETITLDESLLSGSMAFTLEGDTCTNTVLAPGDRCTLDLGFRTDTPGQQEAALIIGDNSSSHVQRVVLQGTGVTDLAPDTDNSPSNPSGNRPTNNPNPGTTRSPEIKGFNASPATGLQPTDTTRLCYEIDQATQAYLVNETTGERITLPNASAGCVTQTPGRNTTYTLVAMNQTSQEVRRGLDVAVAQPDREPPMTPRAIAPTGGDTVYCTNSANLTWSAATDNNGPVSYIVTLQRWEAASANDEEEAILVSGTWVNVQTMTTAGTQLNLSGLIMPPFTYRWQVKAIDAAGNVSQPSAWAQFWCIAP